MPIENRDFSSDVIKAAAIIGVALIHSSAPFANAFRFCVPAFIGIWSIYLEKSFLAADKTTDNKPRTIIYTRLKHIIPPYLFWSAIYISLNYDFQDFINLPLHTLIFGQMGGYGFAGQYFFIILLQLLATFIVIRNLINRKNFAAIVIIGLSFNSIIAHITDADDLIGKIGYRALPYWIPYVTIGIAVARGWVKTNPSTLFLGFAISPLAVLELKELPEHASYLAATVSIASALILASLANPNLDQHLRSTFRPPIARVITIVGSNTFPIFLTNVLWISVIKSHTPLNLNNTTVATLTIVGGLVAGAIFRFFGLGMLVGTPNISTRGSQHPK